MAPRTGARAREDVRSLVVFRRAAPAVAQGLRQARAFLDVLARTAPRVPAALHDEPLSSVDAAWLRMDDPTSLMVINALLIVDGTLEPRRLRALLQERLLAHPRFRQRVLPPRWALGLPRWRDDPDFDLDAHVRWVQLPAGATERDLQALVGEQMSVPLERARPLWQVHVVQGLPGKTALLARVHHAVADGIALVRVLGALTDPAPGTVPPSAAAPPPHGELRGARAVLGALTDLGRLAVLPADPRTALKRPLGVAKRAAWSPPLSLAALRATAKTRGVKVNDVLMAAIAGALRRVLLEHAALAPGLTLRAVVPVDLRGGGELVLGNQFGLVFVELPVGLADAPARLARVARTMDALKRSPEALATYALLDLVGHAGAAVEEVLVDVFGAKASLVVTNVPGPRARLVLAGRPLDSVMVWVPQSGRLGLGVSLLSYAGEVRIGVAADAGVVPDPGALVAAIVDEVACLRVAWHERPVRQSAPGQ